MESDRVSVLCGAIGILATIGCAGGETGEYADVELPEWRIEEVARPGDGRHCHDREDHEREVRERPVGSA